MTENIRHGGASENPLTGASPNQPAEAAALETEVFRGLPKTARLAKRRQFLAVTDRANTPDLKFSAGCFLLIGRANGLGFNRLGVTVSKKTAAKAVDRNRIKRIAREFFRLNTHLWPGAYDLVFIARFEAAGAARRKLWDDLERIGRKLAGRKPEKPSPDKADGRTAGPETAAFGGLPPRPWPVRAFLAGHDFVEWLLKGLTLGFIYMYQRLISPLLPPSCRFRPTCSRYAVQAITVHGFWRGSYLAARRLLKCHPFHPGGYDPVPPRKTGA